VLNIKLRLEAELALGSFESHQHAVADALESYAAQLRTTAMKRADIVDVPRGQLPDACAGMNGFNTLEVEFCLPCGHTLRRIWTVKLKRDVDDHNKQPENYHGQMIQGIDVLNTWLVSRAERHRCDLVTEDNPNGQVRLA
jgi:hypothetical protein